MPDAFYNRGKYLILGGTPAFNLATDTIKAMLVRNTYTFGATHNVVSDLTPASNEVTGGGYARQTLASKTITEDDTNNRAVFSAANLSFSNISGTNISAVILFKDTGSDGTSPLLCYIDSGGFPLTVTGLAIAIAWHANGIILLT